LTPDAQAVLALLTSPEDPLVPTTADWPMTPEAFTREVRTNMRELVELRDENENLRGDLRRCERALLAKERMLKVFIDAQLEDLFGSDYNVNEQYICDECLLRIMER
jgi:hypothetical protein